MDKRRPFVTLLTVAVFISLFTFCQHQARALQRQGSYQEVADTLQGCAEQPDSVALADSLDTMNSQSKSHRLDELEAENDLLQQRSRFTTGSVAMILGIVALLAFLSFNSRWTRRMEIKNQQLQRERNLVVAQNKQLAIERDKAEAASRAKTAFIQSMTHEIRTPLNAISGFSQVLAMDEAEISHEIRTDMSQRIIDGTRMLTNILDDLLLISDYESHTEPLPKEDCLISSVAEQTVDLVLPMLADGVTMEKESSIAPDLIVKTNPEAIQNVLRKLLENAAKFTTAGHIRLASSIDNGMLHFAVSDTGPGIPEDKREFIFERFAKLNEFSQGAGLGLTIARLQAEHLGGTLTLDTAYSGGSKFDLIIPIA